MSSSFSYTQAVGFVAVRTDTERQCYTSTWQANGFDSTSWGSTIPSRSDWTSITGLLSSQTNDQHKMLGTGLSDFTSSGIYTSEIQITPTATYAAASSISLGTDWTYQ